MGLSSKDVSSAGDFDWSQQIGGALDTEKPTGQANSGRAPVTAASLKCPRCESTNTKFCYYNNYSRTQPRHFCRACKRHWTAGGTLRDVPVGGARKSKRPRSKDELKLKQQQVITPAAALPSDAELESGFADVLHQLMFPVQPSAAAAALLPTDYYINHYSTSDTWSSPQYESSKWLQEPVSNWNGWDGVATDFGTQAVEAAAYDDYRTNFP